MQNPVFNVTSRSRKEKKTLHWYKNDFKRRPVAVNDMEVVDLEKKAIEDTMEHHSIYTSNDETVNADASGNVTNGEVEEIKQNQWQFSDEGKCKSLKKKKRERIFHHFLW